MPLFLLLPHPYRFICSLQTTVRKLIRTMCSRVPANRPTMRSCAPDLRSVAWGIRRMVHRHSVIASAKASAYNESAAYENTSHDGGADVDMRAPMGTGRARGDGVHLPSAETPVDSSAVVDGGSAAMGCLIDRSFAVTLPPAPWTLSVAGMNAELSPARVGHAPKVCTPSGSPRPATIGNGSFRVNDSRTLQRMLSREQGRHGDARHQGVDVGWGGVRKGARVGTRHEGWGRGAVDNEERGMLAVPPFPPELN